MKKFFLYLLVFIVVLGVGGYFFAQWRLQTSLDDAFANIPLAEGSYQGSNLSLTGTIAVTGIEVFSPMMGIELEIDRVSVDTGSFIDAVMMALGAENGELPLSLAFNVDGFSMPLDGQFWRSIEATSSPGLMYEVDALGCGRHSFLSPKDYYDMGYNRLDFDFSMKYDMDMLSNELVTEWDWTFNNFGAYVVDASVTGMAPLFENYNNVMFGFDWSAVSITDLSFEFADRGYNQNWREYCARSSGMAVQAWTEQHFDMIATLIEQIELSASFDPLALYQALREDGSTMELSMTPLLGVSAADLQFYQFAEIVEQLDLQLTVNNSSQDLTSLVWNEERLASLNLSSIRQQFQTSTAEETESSTPQTTESSSQSLTRILVEVPPVTVGEYIGRTAQITRTDGQVFTGQISSVDSTSAVIRVRLSGGFSDLPIVRSQIQVLKLYPE